MKRTLVWGAVALAPIAAAAFVCVGLNAPNRMTAWLFGNPPEAYDPANDHFFLKVSGLGCFWKDRDEQAAFLDDAIAKVGLDVAIGYADYIDVVARRVAASGAGRERILDEKAGFVKLAPLFSEARRQGIGEWEKLRQYLLELRALEAPKPPLGTEERYGLLDEALKKTQCPRSVGRIRPRVLRMKTAEAMTRLEGALARYQADLETFPTVDDGRLKALLQPPEDPEWAKHWKGPYAEASDLVDAWGRDLIYADLERGQMYTLKSLGEDGRAGGYYDDADMVIHGSVRSDVRAEASAPAP